MAQVLKTPRAEIDLIDLWLYISEDNARAADEVWSKLERTFRLLAESPRIGPERPELAAGLRSYPVGNYLVFYRPLEDASGIALIRVVHGARDLRRLFSRDSGPG